MGNEGNAAFEKAWQNFYEKGGYGYSLCKSDCAPIWFRPSPQEIVLGRLRGRIRRLFDVGAGIRVEDEGTGGRAIQFCWVDIQGKIFPITK